MTYEDDRGCIMKATNSYHLSEEEIIIAVVDTADLDRSQQQHLAQCSQCRSQIKAMNDDLTNMGRIAESISPPVTKPFRAPSARKDRMGWLPLGRKLTAGLAVAIACVVVGGLFWQNQLSNRRQQFAREMLEAEQLMHQVNLLVENPLPETIMTIGAEGMDEHDEDFFRFLIPDENANTTISRKGKKGLIT